MERFRRGSRSSNHNLRQRVRDGAVEGAYFGLGYSVYAAVLLLIRGPAAMPVPNLGLLEVVAAFFFGGVVAGVIAAALQPLARGLLGRMLVGVVAAFPFALLLVATIISAEDMAAGLLLPSALLASAVWGILGGFLFWHTRD